MPADFKSHMSAEWCRRFVQVCLSADYNEGNWVRIKYKKITGNPPCTILNTDVRGRVDFD